MINWKHSLMVHSNYTSIFHLCKVCVFPAFSHFFPLVFIFNLQTEISGCIALPTNQDPPKKKGQGQIK